LRCAVWRVRRDRKTDRRGVGHKTLKEVERHTKAADQKRPAKAGMSKLADENKPDCLMKNRKLPNIENSSRN
jgi:hypothetical protein